MNIHNLILISILFELVTLLIHIILKLILNHGFSSYYYCFTIIIQKAIGK